ncbi:uncharacterized protein LOC114658811 isoform X2 [Erpetoichthys calabaricus]|uniref:uncharacterized protein LOC114658811 isoform X2 n=1 Tax=Erpetoichthys calabaricus TaxID=27687 RepID=UPI00109FFBDD|nr:uncharacterized protein LOC114658811 isoform X2 [Erpetoichthys calabaricus]
MAQQNQPHFSIYAENIKPTLIKYQNEYKCPVCKKQGDYSIMVPHLQSHDPHVVKYAGFTIYRCNTGCVTSGHFHCCFCFKTLVKRRGFLTHLQKCQKLVMPTGENIPAVPARETVPSVPARKSVPASPARETNPVSPAGETDPTSSAGETDPTSSAGETDPASPGGETDPASPGGETDPASPGGETDPASPCGETDPASPAGETGPASPAGETDPASPAGETGHNVSPKETVPFLSAISASSSVSVTTLRGSQILQFSKRKKTFCCFCNLRLYKKNLKLHIKRRHSSTNVEKNKSNRLPSVCIDSRRGIFAVAKTSTGPRYPIHVQKCTWGAKHVVICELVKCKQASEVSQRSGLMGFECCHLRSLAFSPVPPTSDVTLQEEVLTRMVQTKWFGKETMKACLHHKQMAETQQTPLSKEISLGEEKSQIYLSVFEPHISFRSLLGRVMVHYNKNLNTWRCASCKPVSSCIHMAISKWHLFQMRPEHFQKVKTRGNDAFDPVAQANAFLNDGREPNKNLEEETSASILKYPAQGIDEQQHEILLHLIEGETW